MSQLQSPSEFLNDFRSRIVAARKRVWLQAMVVEAGEIMDSVVEEIKGAALRGVDVRIYFDWVTERYLHGDIRLTPTFKASRIVEEKAQHSRNNILWEELRSVGVSIVQVNRPLLGQHFFPVMGRNHIKIYVADDSAWMGGINFFDLSFKNLDFMVRFDSNELSSALISQFELVNEKRVADDYLSAGSRFGTLVVDAGKRGESLIYEQALEMVSSATQSVQFISQMVPENRMLDLLLEKAAHGVAVSIYTSHPTDTTFTRYPLKYFYTTFQSELAKRSLPITFIHLDRKIHAKLIICDYKEAMFGSHNFVESGVQMGTQEISLRTSDADLIRQLVTFAQKLDLYIP